MKETKLQASPRVARNCIRRQSSRRRQSSGTGRVNQGRENARLSGSSNLGDATVLKKNLKRKMNASNTECTTPMCKKVSPCPGADGGWKNSVSVKVEDMISGRKAALLQASQSCDVHRPALSVSGALRTFLSAVKDLCKQHSLLAMMEVDIQFSSQSDVLFQPKDEDWPELHKHLQSLQLCLQDLQSLVDSQPSSLTSQSSNPVLYEPELTADGGVPASTDAAGPAEYDSPEESISCAAPAEQELSLPPPSPLAEHQSQDQEEDQLDEEDPDWPASEELGVASPEPPAAAVSDRRRALQSDSPQPFVCTSGCEQKPGVPRRFASEKSLRMHQAARHGQRVSGRRYHEYTCPLCCSVQKRPRDLAAHIVTCPGKGEVRPPLAPSDGSDDSGSDGSPFIMCRLCHLCFPTGDLLRAHICQYADSGGVIQTLLGSGTLSVSGPELAALRRFICHQCREEFRNQAIYRVHLQFCRPPPYVCEMCDAQLPCGRRLVLHKMSEHRELNKPMFFCRAAGCGLSFRLNAALQKHLVQRHASQPTGQPFGCDVCDKKFIKKIYLTHHKLRYHHDCLQRDFVCDVCGARLGSSSALSVHVRSVHTRPEHTCDVCGKVFSRQDRLTIHAKIHTGVKPYQCSLCPKAFIQQCKLNDHLRRHRGERRFRCVMCDKMYAASHDLRSHLRRIHNVDMVNKTHTIQPAASLLRPLPPPEPEPEPEPELELEPEPTSQLQPERTQQQQLSTVVPHTLQSVQLHSVQMTAPTQTLHVQDLSQLGGGLILIPAVDASGGTSFYPIINQ